MSLDTFLFDNHQLFMIMSVFSATALFLTRVDAELTTTAMMVSVHFRIVSSLLLFAVIAALINQRFIAAYSDLMALLGHSAPWSKYIHFSFILLLDVLTLSVVLIVLYYSDAFWILVGVLGFVFAAVAMYRVLYHTMIWLKIRFRKIG